MAVDEMLGAMANVLRAFDEAVGTGTSTTVRVAAAVRAVLGGLKSSHTNQRGCGGSEGE